MLLLKLLMTGEIEKMFEKMSEKEIAAVKAYRKRNAKYLAVMDSLVHVRTIGYGNCLWMLRGRG